MALTLEYLQIALLNPTLLAYMNNFGHIGAKVKFTALFYYKNYNNKLIKICWLFTTIKNTGRWIEQIFVSRFHFVNGY
jgi:hypothetical protein